jgi:hypothetical protein
MNDQSRNSEEDRLLRNQAVRNRESAILVSSIIQGFTSHPPSPATVSFKSALGGPLANHHAHFTPLHFSHIRQVGCPLHRSIMPSTQSNYMLPVDPLSLSRIRSNLIRLEDTIIFCELGAHKLIVLQADLEYQHSLSALSLRSTLGFMSVTVLTSSKRWDGMGVGWNGS